MRDRKLTTAMKILGAALTAAILASCASFPETSTAEPRWNTLTGNAPLVIAHRGASGYLPEHTLEAYALAVDQGADVIEPDLVITKDGVLVARHDRYLSTTTNVADKPEFADRKRANADENDAPRNDWWVEDFTLAELKTLRARQPFEGRPKDFDDLYEIPTFTDVLALAAEKAEAASRPVGVYPETKHPGYFQSIGLDFEAPLLAALDGFAAGPVFIQSFEPAILKRLKGKTDAALVQLVYEETAGAGPNISLEAIATYADGVGPAKNIVYPGREYESAYVLRAHRLGLVVHPWTFRDDRQNPSIDAMVGLVVGSPSETAVGEPETPLNAADWMDALLKVKTETEYEVFFGMGVDGVFTDFPDTAINVRASMGG